MGTKEFTVLVKGGVVYRGDVVVLCCIGTAPASGSVVSGRVLADEETMYAWFSAGDALIPGYGYPDGTLLHFAEISDNFLSERD